MPLGALTVLVGPNGSGKTNVLNVLRLLSTTIRFDLSTAIELFGGFNHVLRNDGATRVVRVEIEALVTAQSSANAPDRYALAIGQDKRGHLTRTEEFTFKRVGGRGRRITVSGSTVTIGSTRGSVGRTLELADTQTTGLSTLPKLSAGQGGEGIDDFANFVSSIRALEPNVKAARLPARLYGSALADDASNLADALFQLREQDAGAFRSLQRDVSRCLPGLREIVFSMEGGSAQTVVVRLVERGLATPTELADASFGTIRLLALLTMLYQSAPPPFIAIEEVDHGLHPYALDVLVDALRAASQRTQILIATHSPTLVNRLSPNELIVCDRDADTGESLIPAVDACAVAEAVEASDLRLGELWFSGALRGVPE